MHTVVSESTDKAEKMGCGGSRVRASTPVPGNNPPLNGQNGRADSAPVNGSQGEEQRTTAIKKLAIDVQ